MEPPGLMVAVEARLDEAVVRRLAEITGQSIDRVILTGGKSRLRTRISDYNQASVRTPWLILTDLDRDFPCAAALRAAWLPEPSRLLRFRVAVRAVESWLMADDEALCDWLALKRSRLSGDPDAFSDPKRDLIDLCRQSRRITVQRDMVPRPGSGAVVGPLYEDRMIRFVATEWSPDRAAARSDSLRRALDRLREPAP